VLAITLAVHIYVVTRHKPMDDHTRAMARIDVQQKISQADADRITAWLYRQDGVDHVLVNPRTSIAVFTFFPIRTTADRIASGFRAQLPFRARRFIPSDAGLQSGCPVLNGSKVRFSDIFKHKN
jgi:hypothetical protein